MGGPPNTFTGATQPIPVAGDGSVQAGLPDANTGRDTRGVVNKYSTLRCVSPHAMRLRVRSKTSSYGGLEIINNDYSNMFYIIDYNNRLMMSSLEYYLKEILLKKVIQ